MLSALPRTIEAVNGAERDKEILRAGIMAELDAINLYEQMAALAGSKKIRTMLLDIAREEKTHVGEFQTLLLDADPEQAVELREGEREVREKMGA
jgi:rubrerythrin